MKKIIVLISLLLTASCLFAACGSNALTNFDEEPTPEQNNVQTNAPQTGAIQTGYPTENVQPSVCNHYWQAANCITPMTCVYCGLTQGTTSGHSYYGDTREPTCAECTEPETSRNCNVCGAPEDAPRETLAHSWVEASCIAPKTCTVCNETEGDVLPHNFVNGVCSICSDLDKSSDQYKYNVLKGKADRIALDCAGTAVRDMLKNPSTMQVLGAEILDSDQYFRYYIKLQYSAKNNMGGLDTDTAYVLIRVKPVMDTTFMYNYNRSGINYTISESIKSEFGWGTVPEDWSLDAADKFLNPVEVSIKLILANPTKYKGQIVKIKEPLVVAGNYLSELSLYTYQLTDDGSWNYDNSIKVFYSMADNADDLIMMDADDQRISVIGEIKLYTNGLGPYIQAYQVTIEK